MPPTKTAAGVERDQGKLRILGKTIKLDFKLEELDDNQRKQTKLNVVVPFSLKSLNDDERTLEFVGSSPAVDRYGDSVVQAGCDFKNFLANPVIPWGHNYAQPPVAKALEVGFKDGNLTFKSQFASIAELSSDPEHPSDYALFADAIYNAYKGGYLRAFSIGFIPLDYDGNWQDGYVINEWELLEVSCVTVPANPEALVLAFKEGVMSDAHRKAMIGQAHLLLKTLTEDDHTSQNEDMETVQAFKELSAAVAELSAAFVAFKEAAEDKKTDDDKPNSPDDPDEGNKSFDMSDPKIQAAIADGVKDALKQVTGKID